MRKPNTKKTPTPAKANVETTPIVEDNKLVETKEEIAEKTDLPLTHEEVVPDVQTIVEKQEDIVEEQIEKDEVEPEGAKEEPGIERHSQEVNIEDRSEIVEEKEKEEGATPPARTSEWPR